MATLEGGTTVEVSGLKARPDLNGKRAEVVTYAPERERYQVRMTENGEELYLRPVNLTEVPSEAVEAPAPSPSAQEKPAEETKAPPPMTLKPGTGVELGGLKARPDLNGKYGRVVMYVRERERYHIVILGTSEETYLRAANLTTTDAAKEAVASAVRQRVEEPPPPPPAPAPAPAHVTVPSPTPAVESPAPAELEEETAAKAAIGAESPSKLLLLRLRQLLHHPSRRSRILRRC